MWGTFPSSLWKKTNLLISALLYLNMCDRVDWCPDVESGCWWDCWAHSCRCFYPDIPPPEVERDWCWDQTHWCWTINCFLCTRRESHDPHSPLNTPMNNMMMMMMKNIVKSYCWWQEQTDELENMREIWIITIKSVIFLLNILHIT